MRYPDANERVFKTISLTVPEGMKVRLCGRPSKLLLASCAFTCFLLSRTLSSVAWLIGISFLTHGVLIQVNVDYSAVSLEDIIIDALPLKDGKMIGAPVLAKEAKEKTTY